MKQASEDFSNVRFGKTIPVAEILEKHVEPELETRRNLYSPRFCTQCQKDFLAHKNYPFELNCYECEKQKEENKKKLLQWQKICPPIYRETQREKLPDENAKLNFDKVQAWQYGQQGLIVHGTNRKGKTRAVWHRLQNLYLNEGILVKAFSGAEFGLKVASHFGTGEGEGLIMQIVNSRLVFFDDLGQMVFTERVQEALLTVLEMRTSQMKPIIFTTNEVGNTLKEKFSSNRGDAILGRLKEFCKIISF